MVNSDNLFCIADASSPKYELSDSGILVKNKSDEFKFDCITCLAPSAFPADSNRAHLQIEGEFLKISRRV